MKPSQSIVIIVACLVLAAAASGVAADADGDGIDDAIEYQLLQRFAPVLYPNETQDAPGEGVGVPVSVTWLLRNSLLIHSVGDFQDVLDRPRAAAAISFLDSQGGGDDFHISNHHIWGDSPGDERSWPISSTLGEGVYGRVWKPWPNSHPYIYSVQYYVLLTWNETAYSGGFGNHESDWLCVDYAIDVRSGFDNPPVIHAIYHNHGPQIFVTPELLEFQGGHPVVYVEKGTNEAWPNRGDRGKFGWPTSNGFATNGDWDDAASWWQDLLFGSLTFGPEEISEYKVHREHFGFGNPYVTHDVPNIGDINPTNSQPVSLCGNEGLFLLKYPGKYGLICTEPGDPPRGPRFQDKMWARAWTNISGLPRGPWIALRDPFSPDTSGSYLYTTAGYAFAVPQLLSPTYLDSNSSREGNGSSGLPYRNLLLGIAMTQPGGTVSIQPGSIPLNFHINQPITLTAPAGTVTIGE